MTQVSLKEHYEKLVLTPSQDHLNSLVVEVVDKCKIFIALGKKLPYVITLDNVRINSVHDLTPLLEAEGIECTATFYSYTTIKVTVTNFI